MANIRSAEKQRRQAEKAKARNRAATSKLRTQLKKTKAAIAVNADGLPAMVSETFSIIDKAARKRTIKGNTADRYKSRIAAAAKRANTAAAASK